MLLSAYFSATETAFLSFSKTRMKTYAEYDGNKKAKQVLKLYDRYDKLIATILIGNNIVNILMSSLATLLFIEWLKDPNLGSTVSTIVITLLVLAFGEIVPKSMAKNSPEKFALFSTPIISVLMWLFTPISALFVLLQKATAKKKSADDEEEEGMSQEELLMFVEEVEEEGTIEESEVDLLRSAIEFTERRAEDILTHRRHIEAVDITATKEEIAEKFEETKYSRLLVYNETIDNVVGVIHQKGFYDAKGITKIPMHELMGSVVFVQRSEKISDVLKQLQQGKTHIAVVIDEYGGTFGMITMEDILEELVGEIWDEHDEVVEHFTVSEDGVVHVDASINMDEFCRYFDIRIDTECALVSAYVQEQLDKLPEIGDTFDVMHLTITVSEIDIHHMTMVDVVVHEREEEED
jgi:CBS domain containing-hemolysin-like protein